MGEILYPGLIDKSGVPNVSKTIFIFLLFGSFIFVEYTQFAGTIGTNLVLSFTFPLLWMFIVYPGDFSELIKTLGYRNWKLSIFEIFIGLAMGWLLVSVATGFKQLGVLSLFPGSITQFLSVIPETASVLSVTSSFYIVYFLFVAISEETIASWMTKDFSNLISYHTSLSRASDFFGSVIARIMWMSLHYFRFIMFGDVNQWFFIIGFSFGMLFSLVGYLRLLVNPDAKPLIAGSISAHFMYDYRIQTFLYPVTNSLIGYMIVSLAVV